MRPACALILVALMGACADEELPPSAARATGGGAGAVAGSGAGSSPGIAGQGGHGPPCGPDHFVACVDACGENTIAPHRVTAGCEPDGFYHCDVGFPATACDPSTWPSNLPCGPWIALYDCFVTPAICDERGWACLDAGGAGGQPAN